MKFKDFAQHLLKIEDTSKRLEIRALLVGLIQELDASQIQSAMYLSQGYIAPQYASVKFNVAQKLIIKSLAVAFNTQEEIIVEQQKDLGDLGLVAEQINKNNTTDLNINQVHEKLLKIANTSGAGSVEQKVELIGELLQQVSPISARYIVRIILGTMRLGFTETSIIEALSVIATGDTKQKANIERKYNVHPDIGKISKVIKEEGLKGIEKVKIEVGIPIIPQKCQRIGSISEIMDKMGENYVEYKFDGTRVQLHVNKEKGLVKTFTRNLEDSTHQYPEINEAGLAHIDAKEIILDGEAIAFDPETKEFLPFQLVMQRKRKHNIKEAAEKAPLKFYVFDVLYYNGQPVLDLPLKERKDIIKKVIKKNEVIESNGYTEAKNSDQIAEIFEEAKDKHLEGIIVKKPLDPYKAGARAYSWIKYKKADEKLLDDSIDALVMGYYYGQGVRSKLGIGGFLAAVYDKKDQVFKSITKVGTGLTDEDFKKLKEVADKNISQEMPKEYVTDKIYTPDFWVHPKIIVELGADEITVSKTHAAGFALRFPRLIRFREDKTAEDITSISEIDQMYKNQKRGYY